MSFSEIRHWLKELADNPTYGISNRVGGKAALEREMALHRNSLRSKILGGWIYPSEQIRLTAVIMRVRRGEIALKPDPLKVRSAYFVVQTPPKPPVEPQKEARWAFKPGSKGLVKVKDPTYTPAIPSLQGLFNRDKVRN